MNRGTEANVWLQLKSWLPELLVRVLEGRDGHRMDGGLMDDQMDGLMDGWLVGWLVGPTDGRMDGWFGQDRWMDKIGTKQKGNNTAQIDERKK